MSKSSLSFALASAAVCIPALAGAAAWPLVGVTGSDLTGETHVVKTGLVKNSALQSFELRFASGDHKIRSLGLLPSLDRVDVAMADVPADDPFKFNAHYAKFPWPANSTRVSKVCNGECTLPIQHALASNEKMEEMVFVLRGFHFERASEARNVKRIAIRPNMANKTITVVFKDNTALKYTATIEYSVLAKTLLQPAATAAGNRNGGENMLNVKTPHATGTRAILSGFDIQFDNGEHHLKEFAIKRAPGAFRVVFNDQNTDDPYRVAIDYAGIPE